MNSRRDFIKKSAVVGAGISLAPNLSFGYASAKKENNYEGFGTDRDVYAHQHIFVKNQMMAYKINDNHPNAKDKTFLPCAKVIGAYNKRKKPFRPASAINDAPTSARRPSCQKS